LYTSPTSELTQRDLVSINASTLEDLLKYEPSLIIRRRYIGDTNGTVGMRGSNMFQTPRTMVFVDGMPIHYHLQTRWNGAPRWSMVAPDEVGKIDILYGPFSAEYSGNSMAGVVNIETIIPTERSFHIEGSVFNQSFNAYGFDDELEGNKLFASYGDRFGNFSVYASVNHLNNNSQPQTFRLAAPVPVVTPLPSSVPVVSGAIEGTNEYGERVLYFGDTGKEHSVSDAYKIKLGYETDDWFGLVNIVYEDRRVENLSVNNYLAASDGQIPWSGTVRQGDEVFTIRSSNFSESIRDRESLMLGTRLKGELTDDWQLEANVSVFDVIKDEDRELEQNSRDPAFTGEIDVSAFDDLGWQTAELKFSNAALGENDHWQIVSGVSHNHYELVIDGQSGGEVTLQSAYTQMGFRPNSQWDFSMGVRFERWQSNDGFYGDTLHEDRSANEWSPKLSAAYRPNDQWLVRYSLAQAYRFPIVEELFQNQRTANQQSIANIGLQPESGVHHNLMLERQLTDGHLRINIFHEVVDDAIDAQSKVIDNVSVRTFLPIDEVTTDGIEFIFNQYEVAGLPLDVRFNATYAESEITENAGGNVDFIGKSFPRLPRWRANVLTTYHVNDAWDIGGGVRYASNSYGDSDNGDRQSGVFGAMDSYTFVNVKTSYALTDNARLSFGVDNLANRIAYVHHPWPGRTVYLEGALNF